MADVYDFLVVGAGLSGINTAYRLQTELPEARFAVLEGRARLGGTWAFFRFPGIRSDSSLALFGFPWRPWRHDRDMAGAALILEYIEAAARERGLDRRVRFRRRVVAAAWSTPDQLWTLRVVEPVDDGGGGKETTRTVEYRTRFMINCAGYYSYDRPRAAHIPGLDRFAGRVAHPQFWPADLDCAGRRVVVVGSGATAVTMVPVLARTAARVTMLQRSPSYVLSLPSRSPAHAWLKRWLPARLAHAVNWWRAFVAEQAFVLFSLTFPRAARRLLLAGARRQLPARVSVAEHFTPRYAPFDQRLCITPDGEFFRALHRDNCDIVTDTIDTVTEDAVLTASGKRIEADIIVTATGTFLSPLCFLLLSPLCFLLLPPLFPSSPPPTTDPNSRPPGLHVQLLGGQAPVVDGVPVDVAQQFVWRGAMLTGVPNAGAVVGYTTSSWTLGADACAKLLIRVYRRMQRKGATSVVPVLDAADAAGPDGRPVVSRPVIGHSSTYFREAEGRMPRITGSSPWYGRVSPGFDAWQRWFGSLEKGLKYTIPEKKEL